MDNHEDVEQLISLISYKTLRVCESLNKTLMEIEQGEQMINYTRVTLPELRK